MTIDLSLMKKKINMMKTVKMALVVKKKSMGMGCAPSQSAKNSHKVAKRHNGSH